jgi:hypothetical protein
LGKIEKHPERYDQNLYGNVNRDFDFQNREIKPGSTCCIAAHVVVTCADRLTSSLLTENGIAKEAARLLGVPKEQWVTFFDLFKSPKHWPIRLASVEPGHIFVTPAQLRQRIEHYVTSGSMWPTPAPLV